MSAYVKYTTSTSGNVNVAYTYEEMVTLTVNGHQIVMPKRVVMALAAMGQEMMLAQQNKEEAT